MTPQALEQLQEVEVKFEQAIRDGRTGIYRDWFNRVYYYWKSTGEIFSDWPDATKNKEYIDSLRITGLKLKIVEEFERESKDSGEEDAEKPMCVCGHPNTVHRQDQPCLCRISNCNCTGFITPATAAANEEEGSSLIESIHEVLNDQRERIAELEAQLSAAAKGGEWISVESKMPEPNTRVMVWDGWDVREGYVTHEDVWEFMTEDMVEGLSLPIITHWQPLPEPPKNKP